MLEKTLESPLDCKEIQPVHPKGDLGWILVLTVHWTDWCWSWSSNTLATWCEELTHWKRPWCWERLKVGGEGDDRGWDGWMASLTQWTRVWTSSGRWWRTGKPGMLQSWDHRVRQNWMTEQEQKHRWKCQIISMRWTKHFNSQAEGWILWGRVLCLIIITATKASQKSSFQHGIRIGPSLQQADVDPWLLEIFT